ncbi:hypothetical protein CyaNS01_02320 [Cyanobium sp. NS01]|nr:hypothetical protein CyaNS01_02320 [Cyanobium sp. NS01]
MGPKLNPIQAANFSGLIKMIMQVPDFNSTASPVGMMAN